MKHKPHFLLYPLFILFLIFTQASFGMEEKGAPDDSHVLTRKVAIEILPYTDTEAHGAAALNVDKQISALPEASSEKYKDQYGLDRLFCYAKPEDVAFVNSTAVDTNRIAVYPANSHEYYLQTLAKYRKNNNLEENLLIAKIVINIGTTDAPNNVELVCGVFSSGEPKEYACCTQKDLDDTLNAAVKVVDGTTTGTEKEQSTKKERENKVVSVFGGNYKKACRQIADEAKKVITNNVKQNIVELRELGESKSTQDKKVITYHEHIITVNGTNLHFTRQKKDIKHPRLINKRFFSHESTKLDKMMKEGYEQVLTARANLLGKLFGSTAVISLLNGERNCIISDDGSLCDFNWACTAVFHQSEQAFLTFLDSPTKENYFCKTLHFPRDTDQTTAAESQAIDTTVYLYSTLDICRYCRGTFSWLMHTQELRKSLQEFIEALYFKKEEDQSIYQIKMDKTDLKVFAISNEQTQT